MFVRLFTGVLFVTIFAACASQQVQPTAAQPSAQERLAAVIAGTHRTPAFAARDSARNPLETLTFFEVEPQMTVVEIWPGGGWYTEILAPYLRDEGRYVAAGFDPEGDREYVRKGAAAFAEKLAASPELYDQAQVNIFAPPEKVEIVAPGTADRVLTFRSMHGLVRDGTADAAFAAFYSALKPGGILGVVQHRADPDRPADAKYDGYVKESTVIALAEAAGFKLQEKSEINANPRDSKDHPEGVWSLPPALRLGEVDRDKYLAIGESDRMTLKFVKP
jgi:predicted methyltransferase